MPRSLLDFDPLEVARQLTLEDFKLYHAIEVGARATPRRVCESSVFVCTFVCVPTPLTTCVAQRTQPPEVLNQAWNRPKLQHRAPNVLKLIEAFNKRGLWVASSILGECDDATRCGGGAAVRRCGGARCVTL